VTYPRNVGPTYAPGEYAPGGYGLEQASGGGGGSSAEAIVWQDVSVNLTDTDGTLEKVSGGTSFNSGAWSTKGFTGDGAVTWVMVSTAYYVCVGVGVVDGSDSNADVDFNVRMTSSGTAQGHEGTSVKGSSWAYTATTEFKVERIGTTITIYDRDGVDEWTSRHQFVTESTGTLHCDNSIAGIGGKITGATIDGDLV